MQSEEKVSLMANGAELCLTKLVPLIFFCLSYFLLPILFSFAYLEQH